MATRYCKKCNAAMDYRLGHYECPECGSSEAAQTELEEATAKVRGLSTRKNMDPGAAYKLINPEVPETVQLIEELQPKYGPKARRQEKRIDSLSDERVVGSLIVLVATVAITYTLLYVDAGMDNLSSLVDQTEWMPEVQTVSNFLVAAAGAGLILVIGGLFLNQLWLKYLAVLILCGVMLVTVLGILTPGAAHDICYSWQGLLAIGSSLWMLLLFSRDIPNTASGDAAQ